MLRIIFCTFFLFGFINSIGIVASPSYNKLDDKTDAPIIGVLAQEISWHLNQKYPGVYESYIAASYVKFIEGGGARAVPVW